MRKTKIVCTIGPASEDLETLTKLIEQGMNVARLNFSHGNHEEHGLRIDRIREASKRCGKSIGILLDTKGPEIRTHSMKNGRIQLKKGKKIILAMEEVLGTEEIISTSYNELMEDVSLGTRILLDDGLISLQVTSLDKDKKQIETLILNDGELTDNKGVNVPGVSVNLPGMTEKDREDILFGIEKDVDFIAASFVRRASDVWEIRKLLEENKAAHIHIIPKIENQEGVDAIEEILKISDGLMVARGDLGVEIPAEEVPVIQKVLIKKCNEYGKPVITATQMLDSMQRNPRPTRAEASDVANAILDGTDAIMLSGETAIGLYPVGAVKTMNKIAAHTEASIDYKQILSKHVKNTKHSITEAIGQSVAHTAFNLNVNAIIAPTESGHTARMISKYRPKSPIVAVTSNDVVSRRLSLVWGVYPHTGVAAHTTDDLLSLAVKESLKTNIVKHGDLVIITAGVPVGETGTTNLMKIHVIGDIIAKGQGIGRKTAYGKVVVAKNAEEANEKVTDGCILVARQSNKDMVQAIERCAALIVEEGGLTSHAAVVGLSIGIPVIVGLRDALSLLTDGEEVTVDAVTGVVYKGHASIF